jgi:dsRNA-specific ribonuclease
MLYLCTKNTAIHVAEHKNQRRLKDVCWIALLGNAFGHMSTFQERPPWPANNKFTFFGLRIFNWVNF